MSNVRGLYPPLFQSVPSGGGGGSSQVSTMPEPSESNVNKILQYTGEDTENFKCGYFYKCIATTFGDVTTYSWIYIDVDADDGQRIQLTQMPTPDAEQAGKIVQYVGTTDQNYTNGYFYKCVSDGQDPATYSWIPSPTQDAGGGSISYSTTEQIIGKVGNDDLYAISFFNATTSDVAPNFSHLYYLGGVASASGFGSFTLNNGLGSACRADVRAIPNSELLITAGTGVTIDVVTLHYTK